MGLFELISHIIFPNEYDFDGEYFCGRPIFNQPQLLGKLRSQLKNKQVSAIKKLNTSWHENILCIFGCVGLESVLTKHFLEDAELEFNFIDIKHFDGPRWTNLPGPYIRSQLAEINELYVEEGQQLLKWTEENHTLMELSKFDAYHIIYHIVYII